jgi:hypothetical protein
MFQSRVAELWSLGTRMANPKLNLPDRYLTWLAGIAEGACAHFGDRDWELTPREKLLEIVNIDGNKAPYINQAELFVKSLVEVTGCSSTVDRDGNEIPSTRVAGFLTIGYDNEDLLCVDPSDGFSVWCFGPSEGGDVEKIADSLDQWINQAQLSE